MFLLDGSISVGDSHINSSLDAISSAINNLGVGENLTRIGLVLFGGNTTTNRTIFNLNYDKVAMLEAISNVQHNPGIAIQ